MTATPFFFPKFKFFIPGTGNPAASYYCKTFAAGTSTPLAVFTDPALSVPAANPFQLDTNGEAVVYGVPAVGYKAQLLMPDGITPVTGETVDGIIYGQVANPLSSVWGVPFTPTFVSVNSFTVPGNQSTNPFLQIGARLQSFNTGGTVYNTVVSNTYNAGPNNTTIGTQNNLAAIGDSGAFDSGLSAVFASLIPPVNRGIPAPSYVVGSDTGVVSLVTATPSTIGATNYNVGVDYLSEFNSGVFIPKVGGIYRISVALGLISSGVTFTALPTVNIQCSLAPTTFQANATIPIANTGQFAYCISADMRVRAGDNLLAQVQASFSAGTVTYHYGITIARVNP